MTKSFLDGSQARSFGGVVSAKGVAQCVNRCVSDPGFFQILSDYILNGSWSHGLAKLGDKKRWVVDVGSDLQPALESSTSFVVQGKGPLLSSFSLDEDVTGVGWILVDASRKLDVVDRQSRDF